MTSSERNPTPLIIHRHPFTMESYEECRLVARYMIEDNDEIMVEYDENVSNSLPVIRSILKNFLCNYKILSDMEKKEAVNRLAKVGYLK